MSSLTPPILPSSAVVVITSLRPFQNITSYHKDKESPLDRLEISLGAISSLIPSSINFIFFYESLSCRYEFDVVPHHEYDPCFQPPSILFCNSASS